MAVSGQRTPRPLYPGQRVPDITRLAGRFGEEKLCASRDSKPVAILTAPSRWTERGQCLRSSCHTHHRAVSCTVTNVSDEAMSLGL